MPHGEIVGAEQRVYTSVHSLRADTCSNGMMMDMKTRLEKLRIDAAECDLISKLATGHAKRELFARLSRRLLDMAADVEATISTRAADGEGSKTDGAA